MTQNLTHLTDCQLEQRHAVLQDDITIARRWGDNTAKAERILIEVEEEQARRRIVASRGGNIHVLPIVFDDPGVRPPRTVSAPVIKGAASARSESRLPRYGLIGAVSALCILLAFSAALAGQRLVELDARYAAMERV